MVDYEERGRVYLAGLRKAESASLSAVRERVYQRLELLMGEYDKLLSVSISTLRAQDKPVSIVEKLAKGKVYKELIAKILAEEMLKAHYNRLRVLESQLNGFQSINRFLASTSMSGGGL